MRFSESEIVEDIFEHIRQLGGELDEWHVGTAKEPQSPVFLQHSAEGLAEGFIYREAYTTYAAEEVLDRLHSCGLHPDGGSGHASGKIVFVYRPAPAARPAPAGDRAALSGRAA
jgi:hypothetical protein